jgi:hypothetical protein
MDEPGTNPDIVGTLSTKPSGRGRTKRERDPGSEHLAFRNVFCTEQAYGQFL